MFQDQNFAIIGASHGIGLTIARELTAQGAQVWTYSRQPLAEPLPGLTWASTDVTAEDFTLPDLPPVLRGLVYCPGSIQLKPFHRITPADFRRELEINVVGAFRALQIALPALKAANGTGSAVLFSSVAAQTGMSFHASIGTAKAAVEGLVRALAAEWAPLVRINAVAPSLTDTPLAENLLNSPEKRQNSAQRHPLRRIGTPEDMAQAALYLLSAAFVTGQVLTVDGGLGGLR